MIRRLLFFCAFLTAVASFGQQEIQTITFEPTDHNIEEGTFDLEATASSGQPVVFQTNSDKISINGSTVTINKAGKVTITASQAGNGDFTPATKDVTICINPAKPVVSFITVINGHFNGSIPQDTEGDIQWFLDGVPIPGSTSISPVAEATGVYTVQVTIEGCASPMCDPIFYEYSGFEDEIQGLSVFPNPVKDAVYIESASTGEVEIITTTGQRIQHSTFIGNIMIAFAGSPGLYFVKVAVDDRFVVKKFLKE